MLTLFRRRALVICVFLAIASAATAIVCRKPGIYGLDKAAERAHRVLPPNTSDPTKAVIYIEHTSNGFYYHSNFVTQGFDNPTKIAEDDLSDVSQAFMNILYTQLPDTSQETVMQQAYRDHVRILLNENVFSRGGYPLVDVKEARNIQIVTSGGELLPAGVVEKLDRSSPPPVLMSKVRGCCLFGIPPQLALGYQGALQNRALDRSNVRFLSLIRDSGTESAIQRSPGLTRVRLGAGGETFRSLEDIENAFSEARGKTVVMVSHVEGAQFVVRDPAQNVVMSLSIEAVRALAKKYNVELVDLGCQTAQQVARDSMNFGVATKFNTVDAVQALEQALATSSNYSEFLQRISSENLRVVIDAGFVRDWPLCADIYSKSRVRPVWVKLARLFVSFRNGQS